jgi:predicted N-acetyltransferase YhbS
VTLGRPEPIPAILLGRLAVDKVHQGAGLGGFLLLDAVRRIVAVAEQVGVRTLITHTADAQATAFYARHDFMQSDTDPLRMLLLVKDARHLV